MVHEQNKLFFYIVKMVSGWLLRFAAFVVYPVARYSGT